MEQMIKELLDANGRIDKTILIGAAFGTQKDGGVSISDHLQEFFYEEEEIIQRCLGQIPEGIQSDLDNDPEAATRLYDWLKKQQKTGCLMEFGVRWDCSWGAFMAKWFYGDTLEEAIEQGLAWVKECQGEEA